MRVKLDFFSRGSFEISDGSTIRFWEDVWLGELPLAHQYPSLYNIIQHKNVLVSTILTQTPLNIAFRRTFNEHKWNEWPQYVNIYNIYKVDPHYVHLMFASCLHNEPHHLK
jgi:hypothetical protein